MSKKTLKHVSKTARKIVPVLKIGIISTTRAGVLKSVTAQIENGERILIVTPNPEIILQAQADPRLAEILNSADFAIADGRGVAWAMRYLHGARAEVIPGRVLFADLLAEAAKRGWRVFLLGGDSAAKAAEKIRNSKFKIAGERGPWLGLDGEPMDAAQQKVEERVVGAINKSKPHLLFVGFGAPKQEKWLVRNLPRLKVNAAMTVGGALDYYAGKAPLPPDFVAKMGLEWLWRLLTRPRRARRIFRAVIVFPLKVIWYKLTR